MFVFLVFTRVFGGLCFWFSSLNIREVNRSHSGYARYRRAALQWLCPETRRATGFGGLEVVRTCGVATKCIPPCEYHQNQNRSGFFVALPVVCFHSS